MAEPKDEWCAVYTPPNEFGWRSLRNRVDIDYLPPTDERVGMPRVGDLARCVLCGDVQEVSRWDADSARSIECQYCRSYDLEKVQP